MKNKEDKKLIEKICSLYVYRNNDEIVFESEKYKIFRVLVLTVSLLGLTILSISIISVSGSLLDSAFYIFICVFLALFVKLQFDSLSPNKEESIKVFKYYPEINELNYGRYFVNKGEPIAINELIWLHEDKIPLDYKDYAKYLNVNNHFSNWGQIEDFKDKFTSRVGDYSQSPMKITSDRDIVKDNTFTIYNKEKIQTILFFRINNNEVKYYKQRIELNKKHEEIELTKDEFHKELEEKTC